LLRKILGSYLRIDPGELRFKQGANGKPALQEIDGRPNLHFNLSHSGGLGLFAFSYKHELGVDLECIRHVPEMEQIVERFYPPGDKDLFRAASQDQKRKTFFDCWTRREALVKASGEGLSDHFADFDLVPERPGNSNFSYIQGKNNRSWVVINLELTGEYSASLAINANRISSGCIRWIKIAS
jgi:4'-phosphopantetheinyl transferase